jgi:NAD(P)-dependent dehydrogenase (short-subunit alcohol dehydrogenase family)
MEGRVALITGASSGIGWASSLLFARRGAGVALVARRADKLEDLAREIREEGGEALVVVADLTKEEDVERVVQETVAHFGRLDALVNNAGIIATGTVETTTLADWDVMMEINVRSPFYLMQLALPYLEKDGGSVVNVSSVTGTRSFPGVLSYCVSKAAMDQLTRCVALEVADKGVRVNAINPGVVVTHLHREAGMNDEAYAAFLEHSKTTHPLGRVGEPEEVAELIYFLASPASGWITGATVPIDGGRALTCAR